jgi:hypothetical protein
MPAFLRTLRRVLFAVPSLICDLSLVRKNGERQNTEILCQSLNINRLVTSRTLGPSRFRFDSAGTIKMLSVIKKSHLRFRLLDTRETGRVSLHEEYKNVLSSRAIFLNLTNSSWQNAKVHNARCAFIVGLGMAGGKRVVMQRPPKGGRFCRLGWPDVT